LVGKGRWKGKGRKAVDGLKMNLNAIGSLEETQGISPPIQKPPI
jgi:hypothetical protein